MFIDTLSIEFFRKIVKWRIDSSYIINDRFFMLRDFRLGDYNFRQADLPFRLREGCVCLIKQGWVDYTLDLKDYRFEAGEIVVVPSGTLARKVNQSEDFELDAFSFATDLYDKVLEGVSSMFIRLRMNDEARSIVGKYFSLLWEMGSTDPFPTESIRTLISSILLYISQQYGIKEEEDSPSTRREQLLRQFVSLVDKHASEQRNIPFYAEQLNIAPHYLSTLVKETSGRTVMQWINQAAVKAIKTLLAYSDITAAQISEALNFQNPSSLSKFFKRETGMTPGEYRQKSR